VAARGLDIDNIDTVIQFAVRHVDSFVHRTGRTGRAGKSGTNIVFCDKQALPLFRDCEKNLNMTIKYVNRLFTPTAEEKAEIMRSHIETIKNYAVSTVQRPDQYIDEIL
jgi:ATP-dependent RNA helicase DDX21